MTQSSNNKQIVILFGQPGAGKGTQAELLADKLNLYYLESAKVIESNIIQAGKDDFETVNGKKYSLTKEKELWKKGILNTPEVVTAWFQKKIRELAAENKSLVMTGFGRTIYEAEIIIPLLKKLYGVKNIRVVLITLSSKESIFRNSHRRICELMRHPILYSKETVKLKYCILDGSKLIKRKGLDNPETIKVRLKQYEQRTFPVLRYLDKEGIVIKKVNGEQSVSEVFNDILKIVK